MIDAHAHLSDLRLAPILDELVPRLQSEGVCHIHLGGVEPKDWERQRQIFERFPDFLTPAFGIHPWTVRDASDVALEQMFESLKNNLSSVKTLGEIGLDFSGVKSNESRLKQEFWCQRQLRLAVDAGKPVVLHVVRGHDRMLGFLRRTGHVTGIIHGFRGPPEIGRAYMELGMTLSFSLRSFQRDRPDQWSWLKGARVVVESDEPLRGEDVTDAAALAHRWASSLRSARRFLMEAGADVSLHDVMALPR
jgi:TatD DNase family protein